MSRVFHGLPERPAGRGIRSRRCGRRAGFTLIELLVAMTVIGILSGLVYGALQRAGTASRIVHTKSTIAKLNASLMDRWDSYRTRRLPVDPKAILLSPTPQGTNARSFVNTLWVNRGSQTKDTLGVLPTSPNFPSNLQIAATRLACMRELIAYEMPQHFDDIIGNFNAATSAGAFTVRTPPTFLPTYPPLATAYVAAINRASSGGASFAQIRANDGAECLYLILTIGSTDSGMFGEQLPNQDIGDVDGDGLPEFQDAWAVAMNSYAPKGQANSPIDFLRWAPGFVSSIQPDPQPIKVGDMIGNPPTAATAANVQAASIEFCLVHHDYFDPLKLDTMTPTNPNVRGFQLTPLIYSAGPDGNWALDYGQPYTLDPYDATGVFAGTPSQGSSDDITNHDLDTRTGK
ncbi:MAG TPA: prepilin-type N-terminal cleavage/methylation domain-containing protein [Pirellulales bacterium]|nr:prepilin-type N-terminal cleavage/methylation domain-containing protein [Pirellulales bacterium]